MPEQLWGLGTTDLIINLGYFLVLCALLARDMLWLRSILMVAQCCFVFFGIQAQIVPVMAWNAVFLAINIYMVARILQERSRIVLPIDLTDIYQHKFTNLSQREFRRFWQWGEVVEFEHGVIYREGDNTNDLMLVLSGEVHIHKQGREIARLGPGSFIGEMSFLSGHPASAEAAAEGPVRCMAWHKPSLWRLKKRNPDFMLKLQQVLSNELSDKLKVSS